MLENMETTAYEYGTEGLDHLGIMVGICKQIELAMVIDQSFIGTIGAEDKLWADNNSGGTGCAGINGAGTVSDAGRTTKRAAPNGAALFALSTKGGI
jgi:hypothetical protein